MHVWLEHLKPMIALLLVVVLLVLLLAIGLLAFRWRDERVCMQLDFFLSCAKQRR